MKDFLNFLKLKETRIFIVFSVFSIILIVVLFLNLKFIIALIFAIFLIVFAIQIAINSYSLAKTRFVLDFEKKRNKYVFDILSEGVITYDKNFKILSINKAAQVITSLKEEEILNKIITPELAQDPKLALLVQIIFPSLAPVVIKKSEGSSYPQVVRINFQEPRELYLEVTTTLIFDENNKQIGFAKIIRDRSREIELSKSKSEFITIAAHQLRTPLSGIKWTSEMLLNQELGELNSQQLDGLKQINENIAKLIELVEDLLDVSKIEEGKFGYVFEKADLIKVIEEVVIAHQEMAKQYKVKIIFNKPSTNLPLILMDKDKISIVIQNLIENAIKYNVENGEVKINIELLKDKPFIQVSVEDTGIGINKNDLPKLFTKFFRSQDTLKKETSGSGLGLYISKNIIKRHGGEIWAKSIEKRGSTFYFVLPTDEKLIPPVEIIEEEF
jgi:signal transduction histidine kinase